MKKSFLLLFMALMSITAWAEDLTGNEGLIVAVADKGYGGADLVIPDEIRVTLDGSDIPNTYWEIEGYYESKDGTKKDHLKDLNVGETRFVKIAFKGVYSGEAWGEFEITKGKVLVTVKTADYFQRAFMGANPAAIAKTDVTIKVNGVAATASEYLNIADVPTYTTNAAAASPVGDYTLSFTGISLKDATNYDLEYSQTKFVVTPAEINTGGLFAFDDNYTAGDFTYTASEQKPTVSIVWDVNNTPADPDDDITLNEGEDFTVAYKVGGEVVASPTDAADYEAYITGIGNYGGEGVDVNDLDFAIAKASITVLPLDKTKPYDATAFDPTTAQFNVAGRLGADATATVTGITLTEVDALAADVASYTVKANLASAKIGDVSMSKNYDITLAAATPEVEWEITKAALTITGATLTMTKGDASFPALDDATVEYFTVVGAAEGEEDAIKAKYSVAWADGAGEALDGLTYATVTVKTYDDAINLIQTADPIFNNYEVTEVKGKLTVKGANFAIMPTVASEVEYGDDYTIGYYTTGEIDEDELIFVIGETEYAYKDKATWTLPTERGNYNVTIKAGTVVGAGASAGATGSPLPTAYNIVPKKLTLTVKDQTVHKMDPTTIIDELTAANEGADGIEIAEDLAFEDKIADLNLTYSLDETLVTIEDGKITSDAGDIANAILVALGNENYVLNGGVYTKGTLTISTAFTADLVNDGTAPAVIAEAAANGSAYDVTITGRTLKGGQFNVMVLPFDVDPLTFCKAIGQYAIFNRLVSATGSTVDDAEVKFGLELGTIPANEPFLVKPQEAVTFDGTQTFKGVTFKAGDPEYTVAGAEFIGTYAAAIDLPANSWAMQKGSFKHFSNEKADAVKFTNGYINLTSGASSARFFVEEPDGNNATAIKQLNLDTMESVDLDGWYTVGGVKLQGAPTEKGVYINNGKKVVIK